MGNTFCHLPDAPTQAAEFDKRMSHADEAASCATVD
jgi:hypothetical protein